MGLMSTTNRPAADLAPSAIRAFEAVAAETIARARRDGVAFLADLRLSVHATECGEIRVEDLHTDEVLLGGLAAIVAERVGRVSL